MLTADEIRDINQAGLDRIGAVCDALWSRNGRPTGDVISRNPDATTKRFRHFHMLPFGNRGSWADLDQAGVQGNDVISLAQWWLDCDREEAAEFITETLRRNPPMPGPSIYDRPAHAPPERVPSRMGGRVVRRA